CCYFAIPLSPSALTMFVSLLLLWVCFCFFLVQFRSRRPKNFPPGPTALPFLGNVLNLNESLSRLKSCFIIWPPM
uniref:Cytochrome P450 n=1 Tax=Neogobius melanostomus TaxID=47308 RepID=A0A8C6S9K6_9GOBI